jgi:tetratricopeptide (TPR) repeat protein
MEATSNKKAIFALRVYAVLILLYAVFDIVTAILPKFQMITIEWNIDLIHYFFTFTGIALYTTPINILVGYGLLRRRFWARYGAIAVMLTFPVHILTQFLWWGAHSLKDVAFVVQFLFVILTLLCLSRRPVKPLFDETRSFRFISWHGLLASLILLISFSWILFSFYWKVHAAWKFGHPFFIDKPQGMTLEKPERPEVLEKYRKVELLNVALLLPKEFSIGRIHRIEKQNQKWVVSLQNRGLNTKGFIVLRNDFPYDELLDQGIGKMLGSSSKFNLEKYVLTNNWNPGLAAVRSLISPNAAKFETKEIHRNDLKGFLKEWQTGDAFFSEFSMYPREGTERIGGTITSIRGYLDEKDILTILSSIEFLKPEDSSRSEIHYDHGLKCYKQGDVLQAQVEFANAYFLSPENPNILFMFAKSLLLNDPKDYDHVKTLLDRVLKLKPDHQEAQKLLKEIGPKLPREPRK